MNAYTVSRLAQDAGVCVATALVWLRVVDGVKLSELDWAGAGVALLRMPIIVLGWTTRLSVRFFPFVN